ncbi:MAG: type II/IV secretion system ATPase subunit [Candidatus Bathyarchaeota archaeon]
MGKSESSLKEKEASVELKSPLEDYATVEAYPILEPYTYILILRHRATSRIIYRVEEPTLTEDEKEVLKEVTEFLTEEVDINPKEIKSKEEVRKYLVGKFKQVIKDYRIPVERANLPKIWYYVQRDFIGYGKIDALMRDQMVEDISCDGVRVPIYVWHRKYESIPTNISFDDEEELDSFVIRLAYLSGRHVSIAQPMLDATLPDGSRVQLTLGREVTRKGSTFTIRKFRLDPLTVIDLIRFKTLTSEVFAYLWYVIENKASILVIGGVAAGKTTLLNCLSMFIEPDLKIVSIEDTAELNLPHENWIPAVTRIGFGAGSEKASITLFDLLKASLRQRPDYIIVGEVRGEEAYTLFQAMSTGHLGMATLHAESIDAAVYRLESEPMNVPRTLIAGLDAMLLIRRVEREGEPVRRVIMVSEIVGLDPVSKEIITNEVYRWDPKKDVFIYGGRSYLLEKIAKRNGLPLEDVLREIKRRKEILDYMAMNNIRDYRSVSEIIKEYHENPEVLYRKVRMGSVETSFKRP